MTVFVSNKAIEQVLTWPAMIEALRDVWGEYVEQPII